MVKTRSDSMLKDHEKFWSFIVLIAAVLGLAITAISLNSVSKDPASDIIFAAKLRILDISIGGLLTIAGMAAQALFRINQADKDMAAAAKTTAEKMPTVAQLPQKVEIEQPDGKPVPVETAAQEEDSSWMRS